MESQELKEILVHLENPEVMAMTANLVQSDRPEILENQAFQVVMELLVRRALTDHPVPKVIPASKARQVCRERKAIQVKRVTKVMLDCPAPRDITVRAVLAAVTKVFIFTSVEHNMHPTPEIMDDKSMFCIFSFPSQYFQLN